MKRKILHIVINYLVRHLLKAVTIDDVLRFEGNQVFIGQRKLKHDEVLNLKEDAEALFKSDLWRYMTKEMRLQANLSMFERATTGDDLIFGKAMLYNLELATKFLNKMRNF